MEDSGQSWVASAEDHAPRANEKRVSRRRWLLLGVIGAAANVPVALRIWRWARRPAPLELVVEGPFEIGQSRKVSLEAPPGAVIIPRRIGIGVAGMKRDGALPNLEVGLNVFFRFSGEENLHRRARVTATFLAADGTELGRIAGECPEGPRKPDVRQSGPFLMTIPHPGWVAMKARFPHDTVKRIEQLRLRFEYL